NVAEQNPVEALAEKNNSASGCTKPAPGGKSGRAVVRFAAQGPGSPFVRPVLVAGHAVSSSDRGCRGSPSVRGVPLDSSSRARRADLLHRRDGTQLSGAHVRALSGAHERAILSVRAGRLLPGAQGSSVAGAFWSHGRALAWPVSRSLPGPGACHGSTG